MVLGRKSSSSRLPRSPSGGGISPFATVIRTSGALFVTPVQLVGGGIHKNFWETEFENRGQEALLQGSLETGRIDEAFLQTTLEDFGRKYGNCLPVIASRQRMAMLWL